MADDKNNNNNQQKKNWFNLSNLVNLDVLGVTGEENNKDKKNKKKSSAPNSVNSSTNSKSSNTENIPGSANSSFKSAFTISTVSDSNASSLSNMESDAININNGAMEFDKEFNELKEKFDKEKQNKPSEQQNAEDFLKETKPFNSNRVMYNVYLKDLLQNKEVKLETKLQLVEKFAPRIFTQKNYGENGKIKFPFFAIKCEPEVAAAIMGHAKNSMKITFGTMLQKLESFNALEEKQKFANALVKNGLFDQKIEIKFFSQIINILRLMSFMDTDNFSKVLKLLNNVDFTKLTSDRRESVIGIIAEIKPLTEARKDASEKKALKDFLWDKTKSVVSIEDVINLTFEKIQGLKGVIKVSEKIKNDSWTRQICKFFYKDSFDLTKAKDNYALAIDLEGKITLSLKISSALEGSAVWQEHDWVSKQLDKNQSLEVLKTLDSNDVSKLIGNLKEQNGVYSLENKDKMHQCSKFMRNFFDSNKNQYFDLRKVPKGMKEAVQKEFLSFYGNNTGKEIHDKINSLAHAFSSGQGNKLLKIVHSGLTQDPVRAAVEVQLVEWLSSKTKIKIKIML